MTREVRCTPEDLEKLLDKGIADIEERVNLALNNTAERAVPVINRRVPVAFAELRNSVHAVPGDEPKTLVDAPHASAVEIGSLPHTPNFERLLAWVKLRGMQGLVGRRKMRRLDGVTTAYQAARVAGMLKKLEVRGSSKRGRHSPIDAPEQVARAISAKIEKEGTKPHWYVHSSLPEIGKILKAQLKKQLNGG